MNTQHTKKERSTAIKTNKLNKHRRKDTMDERNMEGRHNERTTDQMQETKKQKQMGKPKIPFSLIVKGFHPLHNRD